MEAKVISNDPFISPVFDGARFDMNHLLRYFIVFRNNYKNEVSSLDIIQWYKTIKPMKSRLLNLKNSEPVVMDLQVIDFEIVSIPVQEDKIMAKHINSDFGDNI